MPTETEMLLFAYSVDTNIDHCENVLQWRPHDGLLRQALAELRMIRAELQLSGTDDVTFNGLRARFAAAQFVVFRSSRRSVEEAN